MCAGGGSFSSASQSGGDSVKIVVTVGRAGMLGGNKDSEAENNKNFDKHNSYILLLNYE